MGPNAFVTIRGAYSINSCAVCGGRVVNRFSVCRACTQLWGLIGPVAMWPPWVRVLVNMHQSERRRDSGATGREVPLFEAQHDGDD